MSTAEACSERRQTARAGLEGRKRQPRGGDFGRLQGASNSLTACFCRPWQPTERRRAADTTDGTARPGISRTLPTSHSAMQDTLQADQGSLWARCRAPWRTRETPRRASRGRQEKNRLCTEDPATTERHGQPKLYLATLLVRPTSHDVHTEPAITPPFSWGLTRILAELNRELAALRDGPPQELRRHAIRSHC